MPCRKPTLSTIRRCGRSCSATSRRRTPTLAQRLAGEAIKTADHFSALCIRALDYSPPVDIQFGEFLRALITADIDVVPQDDWGYRAALIEGFRLRGIVPEHVVSFSEEALCWRAPEFTRGERPRCEGLSFDVMAPAETALKIERRAQARKLRQKQLALVNQLAVHLRSSRRERSGSITRCCCSQVEIRRRWRSGAILNRRSGGFSNRRSGDQEDPQPHTHAHGRN